MNTSDNSFHFLSLVLSWVFFFGSKGLVVIVVVINGIIVCLALLCWSFGKLFGCLVSGSQIVFKVLLALATITRTNGSWTRSS